MAMINCFGHLPPCELSQGKSRAANREISPCAVGQINASSSGVSRFSGGAYASSRTSARDAMGARGIFGRMMPNATAKPCGSDFSTLKLSWRDDPSATVARKPDHREERGISRNTIAQGVPDCPANLW